MMRVIIFGATGMVGRGVLRECLLDPKVTAVLTVGRTPTGLSDPKLQELAHPDLWSYDKIEGQLTGYDACFFCLGVSSGGMKELKYHHLTYDLTLAAAETLARQNPLMTFIYVSGAGTDSSEKGRIMWARIKGKTENAIQRLPFKAAYMFRPGIIEARNGETSKTPAYRLFYPFAKPMLPLFRRLFPKYITTTEQMGRAMIKVASEGAPKSVLESADIVAKGL